MFPWSYVGFCREQTHDLGWQGSFSSLEEKNISVCCERGAIIFISLFRNASRTNNILHNLLTGPANIDFFFGSRKPILKQRQLATLRYALMEKDKENVPCGNATQESRGNSSKMLG